MTVIVTKGQVDNGSKVYRTGEIIEGLSQADEMDLVNVGVAQFVTAPKEVAAIDKGGERIVTPTGEDKDEVAGDTGPAGTDDGPNTSIPGLEDKPASSSRKK